MKFRQYIIIFSIIFFSCQHDRNNPIAYSQVEYSSITTNSSVRDFVIIEDFSAEDFHYNAFNHSCTQGYDVDGDGIYEGITGEQDCNGFWCEWDGSMCSYIDRDLIAVANDEEGLVIYEIINGEINPNEIYYRNLIEYASADGELDTELRVIYYANSHNTLYMLDKFEYIYNLYLPPVLSDYNGFPNEHVCTLPQEQFLEPVQCGEFDHSTKFVVNENNPNTPHQLPFEMFILYKDNPNTNYELTEGFSEIRKYWYNNNPNGDENYSPVCDNAINIDYSCDNGNALIENLNYDVTDLHFDNNYNRLFVANPSKMVYSINLYYYDPISGTVFLKDSLNSNNRINTVSSYQNYMLTGMKDGGCYITLLNDDGISDNFIDKLHIGDSFSVYDIYYDSENNKLLLSCGVNGVLVYNWDGQGLEASINSHILSSYAYTAKLYNGKVIIGTENGLEVFNIGD